MQWGNPTMSPKAFLPTDCHGWAELLPPRAPRPPLRGRHRVPWVIVGAGVTGLICAMRLAALRPDEKIFLLEGREIGQGATGRSSGFVVDSTRFGGPFDPERLPTYRRINRLNRAGLAILRQYVESRNISCDWEERGLFHGAADTAALRELAHYLAYLRHLELEHTPLDDEALAEKLGTPHYRAGVHVHDGALLQPAALLRGLAAAVPANVSLFENTPVLAMDVGQTITLNVPDGEVKTDKLLLATNFEITRLGLLRRRLTSLTLSGSFTRPLTDAEMDSLGSWRSWGLLSLHDGGATVRVTMDRRVCLRNTAEFLAGRLLSEAQLHRRKRQHRAAFLRRFPQLRHVPFAYVWSGAEGVSRNRTNFFGSIGKNVFFAGGYNGSGLSRGAAFGTAMADYVTGTDSSLIADCLASFPASWLPPRPFLDIGAALAVRRRFLGVGKDL